MLRLVILSAMQLFFLLVNFFLENLDMISMICYMESSMAALLCVLLRLTSGVCLSRNLIAQQPNNPVFSSSCLVRFSDQLGYLQRWLMINLIIKLALHENYNDDLRKYDSFTGQTKRTSLQSYTQYNITEAFCAGRKYMSSIRIILSKQ